MSALYLHIPFCIRKCSYCDFYSCEDMEFMKDFLKDLPIEMDRYAGVFSDSTFDTLYIGGGTPSLLSAEELQSMLRQLQDFFVFTQNREASLEVNPGTIVSARLNAYLKSGINRLSIGVQSFHEDELQLLGRIHHKKEALNAVKMARMARFDNIGIDLIYGLPNQSLMKWKDSLNLVIDLQPDHISAYALTWSNKTPLGQSIAKGDLPVPDENLVSEMFLLADELFVDAGYIHYEISNYAKPGRECRHNLHYWDGSAYLGLGPSAHSYNNNSRWWNMANVHTYLLHLEKGGSVISEKENLSEKEIQTEKIALGLRTNQGISLAVIDHPDEIRYCIDHHLAVQKQDRIILTSRGMLLADEIAARLI